MLSIHIYMLQYVVPALLLGKGDSTHYAQYGDKVGSLKRRIYKLFYKWLNVKPIAISLGPKIILG